MKRHGFDPISFVFGLVFAALALLLATERFEETEVGIEWIGAGSCSSSASACSSRPQGGRETSS